MGDKNNKFCAIPDPRMGSWKARETTKSPMDHELSFGEGLSSGRTLTWRDGETSSHGLPVRLYRFLKESIPVVSGCIWTWSRLTAAPAEFRVPENVNESQRHQALERLSALADRLFPFAFRRKAGFEGLLPMLFDGLFTDGAYAGFVRPSADRSRLEAFDPVDVGHIVTHTPKNGRTTLALETESGIVSLDRPDFHYFGLNTNPRTGLGRSILSSIPFVAYVERRLVEDMQRASHNSGFHRLHVKVKPPERQPGETENEYTDRANEYFDTTARMIRQTQVDDNPVTWDDISIEYIGPSRSRGDADGWFINHRAMIEEVCAGTNLAPFLLGYSFGATETWSAFKYDLVMRQTLSVQREAARFLKWLGDIELALGGFDFGCEFSFDNHLAHQLVNTAKTRSTEVESLVRLFESGLIDKREAQTQARRLFN